MVKGKQKAVGKARYTENGYMGGAGKLSPMTPRAATRRVSVPKALQVLSEALELATASHPPIFYTWPIFRI